MLAFSRGTRFRELVDCFSKGQRPVQRINHRWVLSFEGFYKAANCLVFVKEREIWPIFLSVCAYPYFNFPVFIFAKVPLSNLNWAVGHHQPLDSDKSMKDVEFGPILLLQGDHPIGIDYY